MSLNRKLPMVNTGHFSMVPRSDVPRSTFQSKHKHLTAFAAGYLVPIFVDEVLPGDVHRGDVTIFARLANLIFPLMDDVELETFFFFVPNRLIWSNWRKMMGERLSPSDSISYTTPQIVSAAGGFAVNSIYDYFGLPTVGQVGGGSTVSVNALPLRAYELIFDEWFRDENLDTAISSPQPGGDGPDLVSAYQLQLRRKKHDYFTSCVPYPVKGGLEAAFPLSGYAPVKGIGYLDSATPTSGAPAANSETAGNYQTPWSAYYSGATNLVFRANAPGASADPLIYADLGGATGVALNSIRLAVATQQLLERDMRGGTRYVELLQQHFGVFPEDARLQRPEYIGGGRSRIDTQAIPQTSATSGSQHLGALAGQATVADQHSFSHHATEHGFIIGLVNVRATVTYQQGLRRLWTRSTRYDHYWPAFANLGEQVVRNDEIYCIGGASGQDQAAFGYQERWAEYRHFPSQITGLFRSTSASNIDEWHLAQQFGSLPVLNSSFLQDDSQASLRRAFAAGATADNLQVLFDSVWNLSRTRAMPVYSVPGLDRF